MGFDLQDIAALAIVAAAAVYLTVSTVRTAARRSAGGCSTSCAGCPAARPESKPEPNLVTIEIKRGP